MEGKVAVYVHGRYAKPAYKVESYDIRAWPGLEFVCHALQRMSDEQAKTEPKADCDLECRTCGCQHFRVVYT